MTSNPGIKPPMRNVTPSGSDPQTTNAYSPSVPISVYRELAAELQAAQKMMDSLNAQNQHLARQNQQLRQEIEKVIQSHAHLQQVVAASQSGSRTEVPPAYSEFRPEPTPTATVRRPRPATPPPQANVPPPSPPPQMAEPPVSAFSQTVFTEREEGRYRRPTPPERASDVSGWMLVVAIFLIVATAFGTGFLIVRPLLKGGR